jgi:hypothetical protein
LDRTILIFVSDRNGNEINGADVRFFTNGNLLGSAVSAKGRASIQLENPGAPITAEVEYEGEAQRAQLAEDQKSYEFTYDTIVKKPLLQEYLPAMVGLLLLAAGAGLAFSVSPPGNFEKQVILILLSLGAGGVASIIPGFLNVRLTLGQTLAVSAAGALGVFVIVFFNLPSIADEPVNNSSGSQSQKERKCKDDFYGLWMGTYTTNDSKILQVKYTISSKGENTVIISELQGEPRPKTYYVECSTSDLIFTDGSAVVDLRVQGPDDLSGLVKSADGGSRGDMQLHRSEVPQR